MFNLFGRAKARESWPIDFSIPAIVPHSATAILNDDPVFTGLQDFRPKDLLLEPVSPGQTSHQFIVDHPGLRLCDARVLDALVGIAVLNKSNQVLRDLLGVEGFVFFYGTTFEGADNSEYVAFLNLYPGMEAIRYIYRIGQHIEDSVPTYAACIAP